MHTKISLTPEFKNQVMPKPSTLDCQIALRAFVLGETDKWASEGLACTVAESLLSESFEPNPFVNLPALKQEILNYALEKEEKRKVDEED